MQTNRLNHLQILLKRRHDQSHLLIHLGKSGKVKHYLWDKHVNEEGETLQDLGKSRSICCWRPLRTGRARIYEEWSWQGGSCCGQRRQRNNLLDFLRLLPAPGPLPAQTWTCILCYYLYPVCLPQPTLTRPSADICLPASSRSLEATSVCCLLSFSCHFFLFFPTALLPIHCNPPSSPGPDTQPCPSLKIHQPGDGKCHLSWWSLYQGHRSDISIPRFLNYCSRLFTYSPLLWLHLVKTW